MAVKVTRRHLAALAALPLSEAQAQNQPAGDDLSIQRENLKRWREQMAKSKLPIATEPAFVFKA